MATPQTKGLQFRSFARAFKRLRGDEAFEGTLRQCPPEIADGLRFGTFVTGGWYPVSWYSELHSAAQRATKEGPELARAVSKEGIQDDFRGVYRLITLALSPQSILKWAPKVVALYYDTGRCVIESADRGSARAHFKGFTGFDRNLWEDVIGGCLGVMELAGAKNTKTRMSGGGKEGDEDMILEVKWTT